VLKRSPSQEISSVTVSIYGIPALRWKSYGEYSDINNNFSQNLLSLPVMTSDGNIYSLPSRYKEALKINSNAYHELTNLNLDGT